MKKFFSRKFMNINVVVLLVIAALLFVGAAREVFDVGILKVRTIQALHPQTTVTVSSPITWNYTQGITKSSSSGYTAGTGMSLTVAELKKYNVFYIDATGIGQNAGLAPAGSGVTVVLPTPTAEIDGKIFSIVNVSGTTPVFSYASGKPIKTTSGTTEALKADAHGDIFTLMARYQSGVSYYLVSSQIQ